MFKEEQKFTQWWLWVLLLTTGIVSVVLTLYPLLMQFMEKKIMLPKGNLVFLFTSIGIIFLFLIMKLKTEIDDKKIKMTYIPFIKKVVEWKDVQSARVINYGFVGGWGIRLWTKYGTVYNTKGKIGLAIELKNGKKFLIGTQKEEELNKYIQQYHSSNSNN